MRNGSQRRRNHHKSQKTQSRKGLRPPFGVRGSFLEWFWYQKGAKITKSVSKWSQKGAKMTPNCSQSHYRVIKNYHKIKIKINIKITIESQTSSGIKIKIKINIKITFESKSESESEQTN